MLLETKPAPSRLHGHPNHRRLVAARWMPADMGKMQHWVPAGSVSIGPSAQAWDGDCGAPCVASWDLPWHEWPKCPDCQRAEAAAS